MNKRYLALVLLTLLGAGCSTTTEKQNLAYRIEPLQTIRHGTPSASSYYQLGRYYQGQNRLDQAEDAYLKATALDDKHLDAYNALGSLYAQRGETERAAKVFERLTTIVPDAAYFHNNLGYAYFLMGRQNEAYASVRTALALDSTLERGWSNLERIVAGQENVLASVKSRSLDALPLALGPQPSPEVAEPKESSELQVAHAPQESGFTVVTAPESRDLIQAVQVTDPENSLVADTSPPDKPETATDRNSAQVVVGRTGASGQTTDGRFMLVSARREIESNEQPIDITETVASQTFMRSDILPEPAKPNPRLEISNGNGISQFASRFTSHLKNKQIAVTRITNFARFGLKTTVVEYQPGFANEAQALVERIQLKARLVPAVRTRAGVDIRIVLGQDALSPQLKPTFATQGHKSNLVEIS